MRKFTMFITAVCVLYLIKLRWPRNKSLSKLRMCSDNGRKQKQKSMRPRKQFTDDTKKWKPRTILGCVRRQKT